MMPLQETMCVTRAWDFEGYDHVEYIPKITPENPNSDCYRNEHGTRRGPLL